MKKRDLYWVKNILVFLLITIIFTIISAFNLLQFNSSYMEEECEELQLYKRQIEWAIKPILEQNNYTKLQQYCNDFKNEDIEFRIFDKNKTLIATSNPENKNALLSKDSKILSKHFSKIKLYKYALKDRKIGIREKYYINNQKYYLEITISQADVMKTITLVQRNTLVFFVICLLLFITGLIQIFYTLRKSFNKLEDSVIELANGNLEKEIEIPELSLLQELTFSIKKMTQRLKTQIARLSQLEQYKSQFLQNITHEIKTPITAINSAIELIETNDSISKIDEECLNIIQFQINSINKLVNDILQLSEIEVEKTNEHKNFKMFNLNSTIEKIISNLNFSDIKINFISEKLVEIYGDEELLSVAISNLIYNAIKYSETDIIDIILNKNDKHIELTIKDYGIGIAKQHLNHIFERFYRIDKTRSRALGGTGLGLAIVKNIIELHSAEIKVTSELNKGTGFTITFKERVQ